MRDYQSFGAFARHLEKISLIGEEVGHHILDDATKHIQQVAKDKLGTYQEGWAPLADSTKDRRSAMGFPPDEPLLMTGDLRESIEEERHGSEAVVGSKSEIALFQELGTSRGIPPRPFLAPAAIEEKHHIGWRAANTLVAWISGRGWKRPESLVDPISHLGE